jgi:hypothetical protein
MQASYQDSEDITERFIDLFRSGFISGKHHLSDHKSGKEPSEPISWGWKASASDSMYESYTPCGDLIGWIDSKQIMLDPKAAFSSIYRLAAAQGHPITVTETIFWKRLIERKIALPSSCEVGKNGTKIGIPGTRNRIRAIIIPRNPTLDLSGRPPVLSVPVVPEKDEWSPHPSCFGEPDLLDREKDHCKACDSRSHCILMCEEIRLRRASPPDEAVLQ